MDLAKALGLEFVADDGDGARVVAGEFMETADGEENILKGVFSVILGGRGYPWG